MKKRFVRFMSRRELRKYLAGETLENNTWWFTDKNAHTDSVGFCFFDDSVPPERRMEYVNRVVDLEAVAVFEQIGGEKLKFGRGRYRDPEQDVPETMFDFLYKPVKMMPVPEYSTTKYSNKTMRLVRVGMPQVTFSGGKHITWLSDSEMEVLQKWSG